MPSGKMLIIMTGFEGWAPNQDLKAKQGGFAQRPLDPAKPGFKGLGFERSHRDQTYDLIIQIYLYSYS